MHGFTNVRTGEESNFRNFAILPCLWDDYGINFIGHEEK